MGNIQTSLWQCVRISKLHGEGKATMGMIAMTKAFVSLRGRETVALARELLGGNGIVLENEVIKHFMDMEGLYTYEGSYDINALIAGRELTGVAAFK